MELKYLRLIKAIVEHGSLAKASAQLYLTPSALSHQLKELEESLGYKVFLRSRNKWNLSEEGKELYQVSLKVLETIEQGLHNIEELRQGSRGTISISTECYSFYQGIPSFLEGLKARYPAVKVKLILGATQQPISQLLAEEIDMAIVSQRPQYSALKSLPIFEDELFALLHQDHPLADKAFLEASDFAEEHLIIHSYPLETVAVYQHFLKPAQVMPCKISAIPLTEVSLEMVRAKQGIMCLPQWALKAFKRPEELIQKQIGAKGLKRTHYLAIREEDAQKEYVQDFIGRFRERFGGVNGVVNL